MSNVKQELSIFKLSCQDLFTKSMLLMTLTVLSVVFIVVFMLFYGGTSYLSDNIIKTGQELEQDPQDYSYSYYEESNNSNYNTITKFEMNTGFEPKKLFQAVLDLGLNMFFMGISFAAAMLFSVFFSLIVLGFLTNKILNTIQQRHYQHIEVVGRASLMQSILVSIKSILIAALLFIILSPLYLVPFINIIIANIPTYYLFHKLLNNDVNTIILNEEEHQVIYEGHKTHFRFKTFIFYLSAFIPFVTPFLVVFFVIYLGHSYFMKLEQFQEQMRAKYADS